MASSTIGTLEMGRNGQERRGSSFRTWQLKERKEEMTSWLLGNWRKLWLLEPLMEQLGERGLLGEMLALGFHMNKESCGIKHVSVVLKNIVTKLEGADFRDSSIF